MTDLGYVNDWKETPQILKDCTHGMIITETHRCVTEYRCEICDYKYKIDSGD